MSSEFNLIQQHFTRASSQTDLGVGDDAALIRVAQGHQLAVSTDALVAGIHFFHDAAPYDIGWKSLAVNVSDMAAMGANPKWATLTIALPENDDKWLSEFSRGFFACVDTFNIDLIGGDTTRGPLNISVQIMGEVPTNKALRRDTAKANDDIWVSGSLGDAALGLAHLQNKLDQETKPDSSTIEHCLNALHRPQARVKLGLALVDIAHSAIDISDGLLSDLGHILKASNLGATIQLKQIPVSGYMKTLLHTPSTQQYLLAGGDDYELCFTAPQNQRAIINTLSETLSLQLSMIGSTNNQSGLNVQGLDNKPLPLNKIGYDHFA